MPKIKEFQNILRKRKIDFFVSLNLGFLDSDPDITYFSGYSGVGALVIPKNKPLFLVVPEMEKERARRLGVKVCSPAKGKRIFEAINKKIKGRRIGINKERFTLLMKDSLKKGFKKFRLADLRKELYKLREQKTEEEIKNIKKACSIADECLKRCFQNLKSGRFKTESEVGAFLDYEAKKKGCELAFPTIVASGRNSSFVHHKTSDKKLSRGFLLIDFGVKYKSYCSDISRTVYLGKPTVKEVNDYSKVLETQKKCIDSLKIGKRCEMVYEIAGKALGRNFTHGLGHGLGVFIHESPSLKDESKDKIKENSVFTIEPGIYLKNKYGIRIEDTILMKGKPVVLTTVPKHLLTHYKIFNV